MEKKFAFKYQAKILEDQLKRRFIRDIALKILIVISFLGKPLYPVGDFSIVLALIFALILFFVIPLTFSKNIPDCPHCLKSPIFPLGKYCPECQNTLVPGHFFRAARCTTCNKKMISNHDRHCNFEIRYCSSCGIPLQV